jgi:hypothetical protein
MCSRKRRKKEIDRPCGRSGAALGTQPLNTAIMFTLIILYISQFKTRIQTFIFHVTTEHNRQVPSDGTYSYTDPYAQQFKRVGHDDEPCRLSIVLGPLVWLVTLLRFLFSISSPVSRALTF